MKTMTVKIAGARYRVEIKKLKATPEMKEKGDERWGTCDYKKNVIEIESRLGMERRYIAFIHEVLHALLYESCVTPFIKKGKEEAVIQNLEAPLAAFIRSNFSVLRKLGRF